MGPSPSSSQAIDPAFAEALQVGPGAETAPGARQDRHPGIVVPFKDLKGLHQGLGRGPVHGVARLRPIQDDRRNRPFFFGENQHKNAFFGLFGLYGLSGFLVKTDTLKETIYPQAARI